ncbi:DUF4259 domain-containing protein [Gordonia sp. VNK1]|uniref:DUF4259 domain-containing protein n=1 Tax=Gordonia oleivorans TaxID=3156618 RepID=UPI0032B53AAA
MGTWAAGPFGNDKALDFVGDVVDQLTEPIAEFLESPSIDETFDEAFAALAPLNEVMARTPVRPWGGDGPSAGDLRVTFLRCYDDQVGDMGAGEQFSPDQRAALVAELDRYAGLHGG